MATIRVAGPGSPAAERVLTAAALDFVAELQGRVGRAREDLLFQRTLRLGDFAPTGLAARASSITPARSATPPGRWRPPRPTSTTGGSRSPARSSAR